ncbi:MAG: glycosyltransferase family 4 protein [Geminicoccaceae bacterium]
MQRRRFALIGNQADTLIRFRGPLIAELIRHDFEVFTLIPRIQASDAEAIRALGATPLSISLDRAGFQPIRDVVDIWRLRAQLRELQPDIVLSYFIKPVIYGTIAAKLAGVPKRYCLVAGAGYVFTKELAPSPGRALLRSLVSRMYAAAFHRADGIFVMNEDDRALFVEAGMATQNRIRRLPGSGVDLDYYAQAQPVADPVTFVLAARLIPAKGITYFCEAARQVKERYPSARFIVIGAPDPLVPSISAASMQRWVDEAVIEWPGYVEDVRPWLAQASVFVLPSYYREGLPRSILEAMAMGRAIITTDSPGCRETVVDGSNGVLVPRHDVSSLAAAMSSFVLNPQRISDMGQRSRQLAEDRYDVHAINQLFLEGMGIEPVVAPLTAAAAFG